MHWHDITVCSIFAFLLRWMHPCLSHSASFHQHMQDLGKGKLTIMRECKEFKKGIHMLEW